MALLPVVVGITGGAAYGLWQHYSDDTTRWTAVGAVAASGAFLIAAIAGVVATVAYGYASQRPKLQVSLWRPVKVGVTSAREYERPILVRLAAHGSPWCYVPSTCNMLCQVMRPTGGPSRAGVRPGMVRVSVEQTRRPGWNDVSP